MKKALVILIGLVSFEGFAADRSPQAATPPSASLEAESSSVSLKRPNTVSVELLGRGFLYSINYDRSVSENVSLGAGLGGLSINGLSIVIMPVYSNFYLLPSNNRPFLTAGGTIVLANAGGASDSAAAVVLGGGFEHRSDSGFLFRVAPYLMISKMTAGWIGLSFGGAY